MKKSRFALLIAAAGTLGLAATASATELSRGAMLSASCAGCHGPGGHSPGSIPDISGKTADFIRISLEDFRSDKRSSTVMGRHAKGYTEEDIRLIADYLGQRNQKGK
jgi:sulfide dehydrogenase cytochrome subunit